jgi:transcriptional regulator with XRE-family HTH domain
MKTNHKQILINKRKQLGFNLIEMAREIKVSMPSLLNFENNLPVSDSSETRLKEYAEATL